MSNFNKFIKLRFLELLLALLLFILLSWIIILLLILSTIIYHKKGLFIQTRIGKNGKLFEIYKIRSMNSSVEKINAYGRCIRKYKLDEFPQLVNIILGDMTFVGPRPELPDYFVYNNFYPNDIMTLKPGLTGLASLYFSHEEDLIAKYGDSKKLKNSIYKRKYKLNLIYKNNKNLCYDLKIIYLTFVKIIFNK